MAYAINHIHLKANDPKQSADWWVNAFGFTIFSDTVRDAGDRFIAMDSSNGVRVNISEKLPDQPPLPPGDAGVHQAWSTSDSTPRTSRRTSSASPPSAPR